MKIQDPTKSALTDKGAFRQKDLSGGWSALVPLQTKKNQLKQDHGSGGGDSCDTPDGCGCGKHLCGYFHSIGEIPDSIYQADMQWVEKHLCPIAQLGYSAWARPWAQLFYREPKHITIQFFRPFVLSWANEMAYRMGTTRHRNFAGWLLLVYGKRLCYLVGLYALARNSRLRDFISSRLRAEKIS